MTWLDYVNQVFNAGEVEFANFKQLLLNYYL